MDPFNHAEDRFPVGIALGLTAVDFLLYLTVDSTLVLALYWLAMVVPKGILSAWAHHHQHAPTFKLTVLNRVLEMSHGLHTGLTTNTWLLHHALGHHVNYLDQTKDESRWKRNDGSTMGAIEYSVRLLLTAYPRAFRVGKRYPRLRRTFVTFGVLTLGIVLALIAHRPMQATFLFALPMVTSILFTAWVTYDHHAGLDTPDPYGASFNIMNPWFNRLTGNLGYHTAHHHSGGLHWSKLPALHARLADRIPEQLFRKSTFDVLLPPA